MNGVLSLGSPAPREGTYTPIDRNGRPLRVALAVKKGDQLPILTDADAGLPIGYIRVEDLDALAQAA